VNAAAPGRNCPLSYRYAPAIFRRATEIETDTLYAVGGLYGNPFALAAILAAAAAEPVAPTIVFNGDFNWFDVAPGDFAALNARVLQHTALRGNVETELTAENDAAGCGCGYPEWVADAEVARSNAIEAALRVTARRFPVVCARLDALPMHAVARVGGLRIAIVHGDAWSLAGWSFSQEHLQQARAEVIAAFEEANVRIFTCSHTCLPVLQPFDLVHGRCVIANNGAAGMPNFHGARFGLLTRIATSPHREALYSTRVERVYIEALPVRYDHRAFVEWFDRAWPAGSPAAVSYRQRITDGPRYEPERAVRDAVRSVPSLSTE
jgi:hypothetical protein